MEYTKDNIAGLKFTVTVNAQRIFWIYPPGYGNPIIKWRDEHSGIMSTTKYTSKQICHYLNTGMWVVK